MEGIDQGTSQDGDKITEVYIRLIFTRIGEIDTLFEKYQASAAVEARWIADVDKLSSNLSSGEQKRLSEGKSISLPKYNENNWHPQLYIANALDDLTERISYSAKRFKHDNEVYICERRDIKGVFWEKLELHHFPSDIQELSISVTSPLHNDKILIIADPFLVSGVKLDAFFDQQEWFLYKYVESRQKYVKQFLASRIGGEDDDDSIEKDDRKRSILTVSCYTARRSDYFYWNGYLLLFLITLMSFLSFSMPPNGPTGRLQNICILLLASITFRWTLSRTLPTVSYLTSMDKYAIFCTSVLITLIIWHSIIASIIFYNTPDNVLTPYMWFITLDFSIFFVLLGIFIIIHIMLIIWLYMVPLKRRKDMAKRDTQYQPLKSKKNEINGGAIHNQSKNPTSFTYVRLENK